MLTGKKQTTALGLLLLTALPVFLSVGIFIKQKAVQLQRRQRFETELLQTITVSAEKIVWVKPQKEILVDGKLFDVKSFKTSGGNIIFTGFFDHKEDKLVKHIKNLVHKKNDPDNTSTHLVTKFLFYPKYKEISTFSIQNNWQIITHQFSIYSEPVTKLVYPVPAPPPKYC